MWVWVLGLGTRTVSIRFLVAAIVGVATSVAVAGCSPNPDPASETWPIEISGTASPPSGSPGPQSRTRSDLTFVSLPDFLNQDVGTVRQASGWRPRFGNATTANFESAISTVLDDVASYHPDHVLVAGDLVEGEWTRQKFRTLFGHPDTLKGTKHTIRDGADTFYPQWKQRFAARGLTVHAAVGDHELGDNPWEGRKLRSVKTFKRMFAKHFTTNQQGQPRYGMRPRHSGFARTAYAVKLGADTLLVTLDVFKRDRNGVEPTVTGRQLRWLDRTLQRAHDRGVQTIIVQGHTPVIGPVRSRFSSGLMLRSGRSSQLWQVLVRNKVDLYLAGEVHDVTTLRRDGVTQIAHGALLYKGQANFLVGVVRGDRLQLRLREYPQGNTYGARTSRYNSTRGVTLKARSKTTGSMTINRSSGQIVRSSGLLRPLRHSAAD